jgi:hypothetical protein
LSAIAPLDLAILYRGPLSSCNYGCPYCSFATRHEDADDLKVDRVALERFLGWVSGRAGDRIRIFFTPRGEALVHPWYRDALAHLTAMGHVHKAAIQTNLSCSLDWVRACDRTRLALWCTFHPGRTTAAAFLDRCRQVGDAGVRYSVGVVGLKEHLSDIEHVRAALPAHVYLWVNAFKRVPGYYTQKECARLTEIDPFFPHSANRHPSLGRSCRAGSSVIAVDGEGTMRRCHFVPGPIGNLYDPEFAAALLERPCPLATCECHIGYVHLDELRLGEIFGSGILERIPDGWDRRVSPGAGTSVAVPSPPAAPPREPS